jgi:hypothetical protein
MNFKDTENAELEKKIEKFRKTLVIFGPGLNPVTELKIGLENPGLHFILIFALFTHFEIPRFFQSADLNSVEVYACMLMCCCTLIFYVLSNSTCFEMS